MDRTLPLNNRFPEIYSDFLTKLKDYAANNERKIKIHSQETLSAKAYNKLKTLSINLFNQINSGVYHQDSNDLIKAITKL